MADTLETYNPGNQFRFTSPWSTARRNPVRELNNTNNTNNTNNITRPHKGEDWAAAIGTPVIAAAAGKIAASGVGSGFGNYVILEHELNGQPVYTMYAHLDSLPHGTVIDGRSVATDQPVHINQGETIGPCGNTGVGTGPHLHFEIRTGIEKGMGYQGFLTGTPHNPREFDISQLQHPSPEQRQEHPEQRQENIEQRQENIEQRQERPEQIQERPEHSPDVDSPSHQADKTTVLVFNSRGAKVSELQEKLNQLYPNGELLETKSGIYGPKTKAMVEAFQKAHDLVPDGKAGEQTLNKLNELLTKVQTAKTHEVAAAEPALNMNIVTESNKSIAFQQNSIGLQCQVDGKAFNASHFMRFGEKMTTMETYQNADRSLLGKYLPESDQFEIFLRGAAGASKIAVVNDFSKQNMINLTAQTITQDNDLSQQKNINTNRGR